MNGLKPYQYYIVGALLLTFFFVWPGVWRYTLIGPRKMERYDRITGTRQIWRDKGDDEYDHLRVTKSHWHCKDDCPYCKVLKEKNATKNSGYGEFSDVPVRTEKP